MASSLSRNLMIFAVAAAAVIYTAAGSRKVYDASKYCQTADDKKLCEQMVAGAQNLHDASEKAILATKQYAKKIEGESTAVDSAVKDLPPKTKKSIVDTCKESYKRAVSDLDRSLKALLDNDKGTLMTHLSAALDSDCEDAVNEFGVKFPLQHDMKRYDAELDNALAVVTQQ
nr:pectinesterase inhibitor-like [Ipomoea batatas]